MAGYFVAPGGNDSNVGTIGSPLGTWHHGLSLLAAGDTLWLRGGTYYPAGIVSGPTVGARMTYKNGTSGSHILVTAYPNEVPVLDCTNITQSGWKVGLFIDDSSYIDFKGLTVQNLNEQGETTQPGDGCVIDTNNHITFERCVVTRCGYGFRISSGNDYIDFLNCDAYNNGDTLFGAVSSGGAGGYCDGFGIHTGGDTGAHFSFTGCRAWYNSDDGWDLINTGDYITITNCWAFMNGRTAGDWTNVAGDGDGFKTGSLPGGAAMSGVRRSLINCISAYNSLSGYDANAGSGDALMNSNLYNCISYMNYTVEFHYTHAGSVATIKNCAAYSTNHSGRIYEGVSSNVENNNSWDGGVTINNADYVNTDWTQLIAPRKSDGSLPAVTFLHLATGSDLISAGTNVGVATDCAGTTYTSPPPIGPWAYGTPGTAPSVTTTAVTSITDSTASSGGNVTSAGSTTVTARGVCWSTSSNPVASGSHTTDGSGTGSFTSSITGLSAGTTYYVRAYATNSVGTSYGSNVSFTTTGGVSGYIMECTAYTAQVNPPLGSAINLIFRNNSITIGDPANYWILAGDEAPGSNNRHLDGAIITGNKLTWTGSSDTGAHGIFVGYNINQFIRNNYIDKVPYGIVYKSGVYGTNNLNNTTGGFAYNIVKNHLDTDIGVRIKGINGVCIYNNTFYNDIPSNSPAIIDITAHNDSGAGQACTNIKIKNNIFYSVYDIPIIRLDDNSTSGFESDYNLFYCPAGGTHYPFIYNGASKTIAQWQALGYDTHSQFTTDPNFIDTTALVPTTRLDYGTDLGSTWQTGLSTTATWVICSAPTTTDQNGTWQVGARIYAAVGGGGSVATLTTSPIVGMSITTAFGGGFISDDGGATVTDRGLCWSTSANPTIADDQSHSASGVGSFMATISRLTGGTTYHVRAFAINSAGTSYGQDIQFATLTSSSGSVPDTDNFSLRDVVAVVQPDLGTLVHCFTTAGATIHDPTHVIGFDSFYEGNHDRLSNFRNYPVSGTAGGYGYLYNWYVVTDARNITPVGWHLPTSQEAMNLILTLDSHASKYYASGILAWVRSIVAGGYLKEIGTQHWLTPNTGANNSTGFTAFGSSFRNADGSFQPYQEQGQIWLSGTNIYYPDSQGNILLVGSYNDAVAANGSALFNDGNAIRYIKDDSTDPGTMTGNDGKNYPTVKIGTQVWQARNSAETKYRNGDLITKVTDNTAWEALTTEGYCAYDNDENNV